MRMNSLKFYYLTISILIFQWFTFTGLRVPVRKYFKAFQVTGADGTEVRIAFKKTMCLAKNSLKYLYIPIKYCHRHADCLILKYS